MISATYVNASEIKKEEVENIFIAEQDGYTVSHGKEVTIKFNIKEDIDDEEYQISYEDCNVKTTNEKKEKIKKKD